MASTATSPLKNPAVQNKVSGWEGRLQWAHGRQRCQHNDSSQADSFSWGSPGSGKAAGAGGPPTSPFFVAGNSPWWGSGHSTSCSETAAVGAGLLTSPTISSSETAAVGAGLLTSPTISGSKTAAMGAGLWTSPTILGSETAAGVGGLQTSSPFFVAGSSPFWGSDHRTPCGGGSGSRGSSCSSAPGGGGGRGSSCSSAPGRGRGRGSSSSSAPGGGGGRGSSSSSAPVIRGQRIPKSRIKCLCRSRWNWELIPGIRTMQ
ncbi:UNVERIFIED_CONTAM: hypothetical protein FKN15_006486 [Acipenser sinensis]